MYDNIFLNLLISLSIAFSALDLSHQDPSHPKIAVIRMQRREIQELQDAAAEAQAAAELEGGKLAAAQLEKSDLKESCS